MKFLKKILLLTFSVLLLNNCDYNDDFFMVGQVWHYKTRPGESNSTLTVVSIENDKEYGVIVGVYIDNLNIPDLGEGTVLHFLPMSKAALMNSIEMLKENVDNLPDYKDSYQEWKTNFNAKQCKIIDFPIAQVIDTIQLSMENNN